MAYKLVKQNSNCNIILYVLLFLIAAWALTILYPKLENFKMFQESEKNLICSKKCCSTTWPTPININDKRINDTDIGTKYQASNINCNDGINDTGCVCVPI